MAGHRVGGGVPAFLTGQPPRLASAACVTALQRAGAHPGRHRADRRVRYSIAGRNAHYGAAPNPAAPGGLGGGSSSGPAAAVALGQAEIGLGTDTAGSIRVPASYQGLVGFRSTHGAIKTEGVLPLAPSFDTVGWLTRDVATSRAVASVLLPPVPSGSPSSPGQAARIIRLPSAERLAEPATLALFTEQVRRLAAAGLLPAAEQFSLPHGHPGGMVRRVPHGAGP